MADDKKKLILSILHFLRGEFRSGHLSSENQEGLEVAIQCLESVYDVQDSAELDPPLLDIYKTYVKLAVIVKDDASDEDKQRAEAFKIEGNNAIAQNQYQHAIVLYSKAIQLDCKNPIYYCNRAAAHSKINNHQAAIADGEMAIELDPDYSKAFSRLGLAYSAVENYEKAVEHYKRAVALEPTNEGYAMNYDIAVEKLDEQRKEVSSASLPMAEVHGFQELASMLGNPQLINMATQILSDPNMQSMMSNIVSNGFGQEQRSSGVEDLLNIGQRLAQQMTSDHPYLVNELRESLTRANAAAVEQQEQPQHPNINLPPSDSSEREILPEGSIDREAGGDGPSRFDDADPERD